MGCLPSYQKQWFYRMLYYEITQLSGFLASRIYILKTCCLLPTIVWFLFTNDCNSRISAYLKLISTTLNLTSSFSGVIHLSKWPYHVPSCSSQKPLSLTFKPFTKPWTTLESASHLQLLSHFCALDSPNLQPRSCTRLLSDLTSYILSPFLFFLYRELQPCPSYVTFLCKLFSGFPSPLQYNPDSLLWPTRPLVIGPCLTLTSAPSALGMPFTQATVDSQFLEMQAMVTVICEP